MSMDTLVSSIVPMIKSIDDWADYWENIGFKHEHHEEGINK
jgi:hypothetical protein